MTYLKSNADEIAKLTLLVLKRWGAPGNQGLLRHVDTLYGCIRDYDNTLQIVSPYLVAVGSLHLFGMQDPVNNTFEVDNITGDLVQADTTLMILINFLATRDFEENKKKGCLRVMNGVARAMQGQGAFTRVEMMIKVLSQ